MKIKEQIELGIQIDSRNFTEHFFSLLDLVLKNMNTLLHLQVFV